MKNIDPSEVKKFDELAMRWWDPNGEFKLLHDMNPLRAQWIEESVALKGKQVLDVGCGGGILTESLAKRGALVTGIDAAEEALKIARLHLHESNLSILYEHTSIEAFSDAMQFDVITCFEVLEHVPDPGSVLQACRARLKPNGHLFLSTLNRTPKAYLTAILGAEYLLKALPKGTHDYEKFIKPSELEELLRAAQFELVELKGMAYNPLFKTFRWTTSVAVNYFMHAVPT